MCQRSERVCGRSVSSSQALGGIADVAESAIRGFECLRNHDIEMCFFWELLVLLSFLDGFGCCVLDRVC